MTVTTILVKKGELGTVKVVEQPMPELGKGQVAVAVEEFAMTANNITYAVAADRLGYFKFYPSPEAGYGVIPVWGFAKVVESKCSGVAVGERLYGYFPMASHAVLLPTRVKDTRFSEGSAHRSDLAPAYNTYHRVSRTPDYNPKLDHARMVLSPLFATSYCLADCFNCAGWHGATQVIVVSASSKTAFGTAMAIKEVTKGSSNPVKVVGLTSERNAAAVEASKVYDEVVPYPSISSKVANEPSLIIDMSGNHAVLVELHKLLKDNMKYTSFVGITHISGFTGTHSGLIRERSHQFFAPGYIQKRSAELGAGVFDERMGAFWQRAATATPWLTTTVAHGPGPCVDAYMEVLANKTPPTRSWVLSLNPARPKSSL